MASETSQRRIEAAERKAKALALRKQGMTYRQVGKALGITEQRAHQIVKEEIARLNKSSSETAEEIRSLELMRLDQALAKILPILNETTEPDPTKEIKDDLPKGIRKIRITTKGGKSNRELALMACDRMLKIMDRRAKYLGLDTPPEPDDVSTRLLDQYDKMLAKVYGDPAPPTPEEPKQDA